MIRVSTATHRRLVRVKERRERARVKGQLKAAPHDTVTQDDVVKYLLDHEEKTQERRKRSRKQNMTQCSTTANGRDSGAPLYTAPTNVAEDLAAR